MEPRELTQSPDQPACLELYKKPADPKRASSNIKLFTVKDLFFHVCVRLVRN